MGLSICMPWRSYTASLEAASSTQAGPPALRGRTCNGRCEGHRRERWCLTPAADRPELRCWSASALAGGGCELASGLAKSRITKTCTWHARLRSDKGGAFRFQCSPSCCWAVRPVLLLKATPWNQPNSQRTHAQAHTNTHTHANKHTHTHTHTRTHTHTHTHTPHPSKSIVFSNIC